MKKIIWLAVFALLTLAMLAGCNADIPADTDVSENVGAPAVSDTVEESDTDEVSDKSDVMESQPDEGTEVSSEESGDYDPDRDNSKEETSVSEPNEVSSEQSDPVDISRPEESSGTDNTSEPEPEPEPEPDDNDKIKIPVPTVPVVTAPVWDGTVADGFASGTGAETDPFIIETAAQLAFFARSVDSGTTYEGQFVKLANSLKMNEGDLNVENLSGEFNEWDGIGEGKVKFMGTFDGDGKVISGLYGEGLFEHIGGTVKNVGITNSYITSGAAVVNSASAATSTPADINLISDCYVVDSILASSTGVIVGTANAYTVSNCYNGATLHASGDWNGGIVGQLFGGQIVNCYNAGTIDGRSEYGWDLPVGGIAGNLLKGEVKDCYNVGNVITEGNVGCGICGVRYSGTVLENCGYLEGTAPFAYDYMGDPSGKVVSNDEVTVFTESQVS
ncbi:MAG: hypothetical protein IKM27_06540 [Clostridia bacterium]|nr:hypothetical protein [Clostridia bacterium]